jgi:hypothetical protein
MKQKHEHLSSAKHIAKKILKEYLFYLFIKKLYSPAS